MSSHGQIREHAPKMVELEAESFGLLSLAEWRAAHKIIL